MIFPPDVRARLNSLPPTASTACSPIVPQSVVPWTDLTSATYQCALDNRLREIAICRQARSARVPYELHQHRQIAHNNDVSEAELDAVLSDPVVTSLDEHANLVCQAADELEATATLSDGTQDDLYSTLGHRQATELIVTVSFYCAVARLTNATRVPIVYLPKAPTGARAITRAPNVGPQREDCHADRHFRVRATGQSEQYALRKQEGFAGRAWLQAVFVR